MTNKYDDKVFFEKYSAMERSVRGLDGAGEWPALRRILPDLRGKDLLDLGCGFGWHCRYALEAGAASAVGVDLSERMLAVAREKIQKGSFILSPIEEIDFPDGSFDVVLSSLALHYVEDLAKVVAGIHRWLRPGGDFIFSVEHPIFTAEGRQDWCRDEAGRPRHWPVDDYFFDGPRRSIFLGEEVVKYHRSLSSYLSVLAAGAFSLKTVLEPTPEKEFLAARPELADEFRRPMMLIVACGRGE